MSIIPSFFMNAVVSLGIDDSKNIRRWIGTGFIVSRKEIENPELLTCYIITNKHVVNSQRIIYVRFNSLGDTLVKDYPVPLIDSCGTKLYSEHPNQSTDIIAIQIAPRELINDRSIWGAIDLEDHALTLEKMEQTGVNEGSLVYALGFPMSLVGDIKTPICRLGCISRITDAFLLKSSCPVYLVDAAAFPGNSGGPIISRPEHISIQGTPTNETSNLIGILSAYIPYEEALVSSQTGKPVMIKQENSGLTIVHPVDRIQEVVDIEWNRVNTIRQCQQALACLQTNSNMPQNNEK